MVQTSNSESNFYALLIGIDYYEPNPSYKSLMGAVRDIDSVDTYLRNTLKIPQEQITKLTSPIEEESNLQAIRSQRQEILPTYKNIVNAFADLTQKAKRGDMVYIHYSGHGGRAKTIFPEIKEGDNQQDEGLVPRDVGESGRYLRDVEIATLLKRMTDRGIIVSVVFDSCHSGGATRGEDCAIRGCPEIDYCDRNQESLVDPDRQNLIDNWKKLTEGNGSKREGWQGDYVLLAACRPNEYAYEYAVEGKERRGALTHWMLDTLRNSPSPLTYQSLYNRIKGMVHSKFPGQLPMLLGEAAKLKVFGDKTVATPSTVLLADVNEKQTEVTLDVGAAGGLTEETRFAIYSFDTKDFTDQEKVLAIVEITEVKADSSIAKILSEEDGGIEVKGELEIGCPAKMLTVPTKFIHRVRFYEKTEGNAEEQLPSELVAKQGEALEKVRQALADNGWVEEVKGEQKADYQVAVGREGEYEISIGMPLTNLGSPLMIDDPEAPAKVVKLLVHLAKYQAYQEIDNPESELINDIEYELLDANTKKPFDDPNNISVKSGQRVYLRIKNTSSQPLNVAVLDFEPTWKISQIPILGDHSAFFSLQPGQDAHTRIKFNIPEKEGYEQVKETFKLFVTRGLANFQWLHLPPLDQDFQRRGNLNQELKNRRGKISPLNQLLSVVGSDLEEPPTLTRASYDPEPNAEWLTTSIQVTVEKKTEE